MLYILLILIAEAVKPQAVRFGLDERGELCLQCNILRGGQQALENGVLYALPVVYALFSDFAETLFPGSGVFRFAAEFFRERNNLAAARFYRLERTRGNIAHEHFFKCHGFGAELQAVGIGLFFAAVLVLDGVGQPKSGLPL